LKVHMHLVLCTEKFSFRMPDDVDEAHWQPRSCCCY
jgi:hypothetical protein